jgi:hypothetical protein
MISARVIYYVESTEAMTAKSCILRRQSSPNCHSHVSWPELNRRKVQAIDIYRINSTVELGLVGCSLW